MIRESRVTRNEALEPRVMLDGSAELFRAFNTEPVAGEYAWLEEEMFFVADDGSGDVELWKTDGTEAGTVRVKDIRAGRRSSIPNSLTSADDRIFFTAYDDQHGRELWTSDGTEQGTVLVTDLNAVSQDSFQATQSFTAVGSRVFFVRDRALWTSDGTEAGTRQLLDRSPSALVAGDDLLYFTFLVDGRQQIWSSDGTEHGTKRVMETEAFRVFKLLHVNNAVYLAGDTGGANGLLWRLDVAKDTSSLIYDTQRQVTWAALEGAGDYIYFVFRSPDDFKTMYRTDGTADGTLQLGPSTSDLGQLIGVGDVLYFTAAGQLWMGDDSEAGTRVHPGDQPPDPRNLVESDGVLYFTAFADEGERIWRVTGDSVTTVDLSADSHRETQVELISGRAGKTFLWEGDASALWVTDGTQSGTSRISGSILGPSSGLFESSPLKVNGGLLLPTRDLIWRSDGTRSGTVPIEIDKRLYPDTPIFQGRAYFVAPDESGDTSIWSLDAMSTEPAKLEPAGASWDSVSLHAVANSQETLYFSAESELGMQIWSSDGTNEGTQPIHELTSRLAPQAGLTAWNGGVAFVTADKNLWNIDASSEVNLLAQLPTTDGYVSYPARDRLYFAIQNELWVSDGTPEGTMSIAATDRFRLEAEAIDERLFWISGGKLWMSDGTAQGTVQSPTGGLGDLLLNSVVGSLGHDLVIGSFDGLWKTDGTLPGSSLLGDVRHSPSGTLGTLRSRSYGGGVNFSLKTTGRLVFAGERTDSDIDARSMFGNELWQTDGTAGGTVQVADVAPGSTSSSPKYMTEVNGYVYFIADDGFHGNALWRVPLNPIPGDADGDGAVDFSDFLVLSANFGRSDGGVLFTDGDFDEDGAVDFADFLMLSENFGQRLSDDTSAQQVISNDDVESP